ncbi:hypothetical protein KC19_12G188700 [Ceratodon purpureus]|uniref:non-specific serine/threonine protein kinase n=2 Tax=Ceratodon purpureus TaxID=3225 RepID=A0A8T0GBG6_CERPU|nr:hypothetical protein KC19_12G188700 [Ceratodon purpureus]
MRLRIIAAGSWMAWKRNSVRALVVMFIMSIVAMSMMSGSVALSDSVETAALLAFKNAQPDPGKYLRSWTGNDPCGHLWNGIFCKQDPSTNLSHVTEMNVMNNGLTGQIPPALGRFGNLKLFLVNNNDLTGELPPELGNLTNMTRFQIDVNRLSGRIPPQFGNLTNVKHLHMNNNSLNGTIPVDLSRCGKLNHLILDHNQFSGPLPPALANIPGLTIIQLDNNPIGSPLPLSWAGISSLLKLSLRNCSITQTTPELGSLPNLTFIDMSYNNLTGVLPSNISSHVITLAFSNNQLEGIVPTQYAALNEIQNLDVSNNKLNGSIPAFGSGTSLTNSSQIVVLDFQNNNFTGWDAATSDVASRPNKEVWLTGNPRLCGSSSDNVIVPQPTQLLVCQPTQSALQVYGTVVPAGENAASCRSCGYPEVAVARGSTSAANVTCGCAVPIIVHIRLKSPSFTYMDSYVDYFEGLTARALGIAKWQVRVSNATRSPNLYAQDITLFVFPASNSSFSQEEFDDLYTQFASWIVSAGDEWSLSIAGPYDFLDFTTATASMKANGLDTGAVVGIVVGAVAASAALAALITMVVLRRRHADYSRAKLYGGMSLPPGINIKGVKAFTFAELARATNDFNVDHELGQGGYGKVYKGVLADGIIVAIKRAQEGSMQGATQFYTEIELLSRVHHRNLVQLLGFCNDRGEQMLVYEFMAGGTLRDHLIPTEIMGFARRLHIALGTARGILYLHTEADPPIFHRDIKASNILLDERMNAKVADFGLSKLAPMPDLNGAIPQHVSTIVKGTPGYLDPEYFLTQKLTDKTDVYSFGVVLLEIITGMFPIAYGKNIVREVNRAMETGDIMSIADPQMDTYPSKQGLEPLLKLALSCCQNESEARPRMVDIVRELEDIWRNTKSSVSGSMKDMPSSTFSIDMSHLGEPSSDSFQDVSYGMVNSKGQLEGKIDPR